jgi:amino acid transporter
MRSTEYFTLAFGSIVGVGWLVVIGSWFKDGGPGGAMLAFALGGVLLVPVALVYGKLAGRMPETASEIAYTARVFPPVVSFLTGWSLALAYLVVCPFEAVAIGQLAGWIFPALNAEELYEVNGYKVYLPHLLLGIGTTLVITSVNYRGIRFSSRFQNWTTFGLLATFCVFVPLGLWRGSFERMEPLFAHGLDLRGAALSVLGVLPVVPYFLTGFETVPKCAEEAAADYDPRRFVRPMLLALAVGTFFYVAVIAVVSMLRPWQELIGTDFATVIAFKEAFGWEWLVGLILFGAVLSLLKVFNGMFLASTRLLYALGKRDLLAASLGTVHARYQTPTVAIALVCVVTLLASLLGRAVLDPITDVGSLAVLVGWLAASLALVWGAAGETTRSMRLLGSTSAVICLALAVVVARSFHWYQWVAVAVWGALGLVLWSIRTRKDHDRTS